jgi:hypothetical protein
LYLDSREEARLLGSAACLALVVLDDEDVLGPAPRACGDVDAHNHAVSAQ